MNAASALVAALLATLAAGVCAQGDVFSTQSGSAPRPQGDSFNTQGQRGGPCDTDAWVRSHGGRWDRCQYERECPPRDTQLYGEPDRFPNTDGQRMRGYIRCAADPCVQNGAQCWGRRTDEFRTEGSPTSKAPGGGTTASGSGSGSGSGRKAIKRTNEGRPGGGRAGDPEVMLQTMERCLRERSELPYYAAPITQKGGGLARYDPPSGRIVYNPAALAAQKPYARAYYLATAFGGHVVALKARTNQMPPSPRRQQQDRDYVVGYLTRCLLDAGQLPRAIDNDDPRLQFQDFIYASGGNVPLDRAAMAREKDFNYGFWDFGRPMLLIPR